MNLLIAVDKRNVMISPAMVRSRLNPRGLHQNGRPAEKSRSLPIAMPRWRGVLRELAGVPLGGLAIESLSFETASRREGQLQREAPLGCA